MTNKVAQFIKEVKQEALKVTWPTKKEVKLTTITVLIMVIVFSVVLAFCDVVFAKLIKMILGFGG